MNTGRAGQPSLDVRRVVADAVLQLRTAEVPSPEADAWALVAHVLHESVGSAKSKAITGQSLTADQRQAFERALRRRTQREPLQHIIGQVRFAGALVDVGRGVFVPRPETEALAEWAFTFVDGLLRGGTDHPRIVDLCSGSGALACALAARFPQATVDAVEVDADAMNWLQPNAERYGVEVHRGDVTGDLALDLGSYDLVVANPPYIPPDAVPQQREVLDYDPARALYGLGDDGLFVPLACLDQAALLLRRGGGVAMEHADTQQGELLRSLSRVFNEPTGHADWAGRPRFVTGLRR